MSSEYMDDAAIGASVGRKQKTGKRIREQSGLDVFIIRGKKYVRRSDFLVWLESQRIEAPPQKAPSDLKSMLQQISERVLKTRKAS